MFLYVVGFLWGGWGVGFRAVRLNLDATKRTLSNYLMQLYHEATLVDLLQAALYYKVSSN